MAIVIKDKSLFKQPEEKPIVEPKPDNTRLVNDYVVALGKMIETLSKDKPRVDVVATINRGKDGKMESITIVNK